MRAFRSKVAVITGAASGIGRGLALRCVKEGMKVVISDIEAGALQETEEELKAMDGDVLSLAADVSKIGDVETLARTTLDAYSAVHLLFNNAGVASGGPVWENTLADWQWIMGVNLWGVIHGVKTFVPIMLEQDVECHIVNTASIFGLVDGPGSGAYKVTKQGVVALTETLYYELAQRGSKIKVSALCPGAVNTGIIESERNRPTHLQNEGPGVTLTPEMEKMHEMVVQAFKEGMAPAEAADIVFRAIEAEQLYIITHPELKENFKTRAANIYQERNPEILPMFSQLWPGGDQAE